MGTSPSTKETTLHHYRDPLAALLAADPEVDFQGVVLQAVSDDYEHKRFASSRTAALLDGLRPDGALVCVDAWGNAHIDFAAVIEFTGDLGIPVVGLTFVGVQASLVVDTPHLAALIDLNKTTVGEENCVLGHNTVVELDALKALAVLKNKIRKRSPARRMEQSPAHGAERRMRRLEVRSYRAAEVRQGLAGPAGEACRLEEGLLELDLRALEGKVFTWKGREDRLLGLVKKVGLRIVAPGLDAVPVNSILDVAPLAAKVEGSLGCGATNLLENVRLLLSAADEAGLQPINGGAAAGPLREVLQLGRPGTPDPEDFVLHLDVTLQEGTAMSREGIMAAHLAGDIIVGEIRQALRAQDRYRAAQRRKLIESTRPGLLRIALVKMTSGVGAMGDTAVFPTEPGGFIGARSIMDLTNNLPIFLGPNEYRDGIVHSLS